MKKLILISTFILAAYIQTFSQGYVVGDQAGNFNLKNVDGDNISLYDYAPAKKGAIVIFTCNHCPYAVAYEDRIIELDKKFRPQGYPVIAVNPNDPALVPEDSFEKMQVRAKEKKFPFPYLIDKTQEVYKMYGAKRTPHVYLLHKENDTFVVSYIGTIDDNYKDASAVEKRYLNDAVNALLKGEKPDPDFTKAIGCTIKDKNYQK
ncbi:MAG: thioredoxin family protein [Bacteroidales bacterium]|jgi:peroxiredoxin|nr:thioredoxin family protein [Bacteroidales bacterium]